MNLTKQQAAEIQHNAEPLFFGICKDTQNLNGITQGNPYPVMFLDMESEQIYIRNDNNEIEPHDISQFDLIKDLMPEHKLRRMLIKFNSENNINLDYDKMLFFLRDNLETIISVVDAKIGFSLNEDKSSKKEQNFTEEVEEDEPLIEEHDNELEEENNIDG